MNPAVLSTDLHSHNICSENFLKVGGEMSKAAKGNTTDIKKVFTSKKKSVKPKLVDHVQSDLSE